MKTDRTTKVLLALIAMALFLNAIVPFAQPPTVQAQAPGIIAAQNRQTALVIDRIHDELERIANGSCRNDTIVLKLAACRVKSQTMSGQSKKSRRWWLPNWLRTQLHLKKLQREIRELDEHYGPLAADAKGDHEQDILSRWSFEEQWPKSELGRVNTNEESRRSGRSG